MTYVTEKEFDKLIEKGNWDKIKNVFTLEQIKNASNNSNVKSTMNLVVAVYQEENGKMTISKQKINYQIETSKFATPTEFLVSNLQVSNDGKYIEAISDMVVNNSNINYVVQEQYTETTVKQYESYTENTYEVKNDKDGKLASMKIKSSKDIGPNELSSKVTKSLSIVSYIRDADTWIVKTQQKYVKRVQGPTPTISNEQNLGDGGYNSTKNTQKVNRKQWIETTVYSITYIPAVGMSNSTSSGALTNTNIILGDNEIANKILTEANNQLGVPYVWGGSSTSGFDCSGLVQWCCRQAGANIPPRVTSDYPSSASQYEVAWNDMKPGDVLWNNHHVGIYIGDGKFIHAPKTGDVVKISSVSGYGKFQKVYRFW